MLVLGRANSRVEPALRRSARDPSAFAEFYSDESERLLVFFARRTFDGHAAMDLCAETFAQAFASRRRFRGRTEPEARGWLYAIAHRQLARYLEAGFVERRTVERLGIATPVVGEDDLEAIERRAGISALRPALAAELDRLSGEQRQALQLRVVEQLPYEEVARRLQIAEPAARARVSRALRLLGPRLDMALGGRDE
jgi:RNA polymerase sigma-70 factor, ECF subfamily